MKLIYSILLVVTIFQGSISFEVEESIKNDSIPTHFIVQPNRLDDIAHIDPNLHQMLVESKRQPNIPPDYSKVNYDITKLNVTYKPVDPWPKDNVKLGSVTAVSLDPYGNVVIFHRGDRTWNSETFDMQNHFLQKKRGAISVPTIVAFNRRTGKEVYAWGINIFYMPHGLTIDHENNTWVTDVALHQVMKFPPKTNEETPELILGTSFEPGKDKTRFCKPTSIAVLPDGDFFVADGYCNSRIIKYSRKGEWLLSWGTETFNGVAFSVAPENFFAIPHSMTLIPEYGLLCVADRENGRVQCFNSLNGTFYSQYHDVVIGDRLFAVGYANGKLFVVNGATDIVPVMGYVIDLKTHKVLSKFQSSGYPFQNPHDIAVSTDGKELYVAEIGPNRFHKFITIDGSSVPTTIKSLTETNNSSTANSSLNINDPVNLKIVILISTLAIFAVIALGFALVLSHNRKRGKFNGLRTEFSDEINYNTLMHRNNGDDSF